MTWKNGREVYFIFVNISFINYVSRGVEYSPPDQGCKIQIIFITHCSEYRFTLIQIIFITHCSEYRFTLIQIIFITHCSKYRFTLIQIIFITHCSKYRFTSIEIIFIRLQRHKG